MEEITYRPVCMKMKVRSKKVVGVIPLCDYDYSKKSMALSVSDLHWRKFNKEFPGKVREYKGKGGFWSYVEGGDLYYVFTAMTTEAFKKI